MRKLYVVVLFLVVISLTMPVNAQDKATTLGVKGGVNLSNMNGNLDVADFRVGFQVGVTIDHAFSENVYLLTGVELTSKGVRTKEEIITHWGALRDADLELNPIYLQLPIHMGYKIDIANRTKFVFHAGPYFAYGVGGKITKKYIDLKESVNAFNIGGLKEFDCGFGVGVGLELHKFVINLGYDFGVVNILDKDKNDRSKLRNVNAALTLGYHF